MSYQGIDIEYLEEKRFNIERIFDFLDSSLPLCSVHQMKTVISFFYFMSFTIMFLLYPQINSGSISVGYFLTFFPLYVAMAIHVVLSILYIVFSLFCGASSKTCVRHVYSYHTMVPFSMGSLLIIFLIFSIPFNVSNITICLAISLTCDSLCGLASLESHRFLILFETLALIPFIVLYHLYVNNKLPYMWMIYIPFYVYFVVYSAILIGLMNCCGAWNGCSTSFLHNQGIQAEFDASYDFEVFWNSAYWHDRNQRKSESEDSSSPQDHNDDDFVNTIASSLIDTKKRDQKFPKKSQFQLYKLDSTLEKPYFESSLLIVLAFMCFIIICTFQTKWTVYSFYCIFGGGTIVLFLLSLINSRAFGRNTLFITNLDLDTIDILWDHPSFSLVL